MYTAMYTKVCEEKQFEYVKNASKFMGSKILLY